MKLHDGLESGSSDSPPLSGQAKERVEAYSWAVFLGPSPACPWTDTGVCRQHGLTQATGSSECSSQRKVQRVPSMLSWLQSGDPASVAHKVGGEEAQGHSDGSVWPGVSVQMRGRATGISELGLAGLEKHAAVSPAPFQMHTLVPVPCAIGWWEHLHPTDHGKDLGACAALNPNQCSLWFTNEGPHLPVLDHPPPWDMLTAPPPAPE